MCATAKDSRGQLGVITKQERAEGEAARLRQFLELRRSGRTIDEAQREVGLSLPHTTLNRRLAKLEASGIEGLLEHRHPPPAKVTPEILGFVEGLAHANALMRTEEIALQVERRFGIAVSLRRLQVILKGSNLAHPVSRFPSAAHKAARVSLESDVAESLKEVTELDGAGLALLPLASELTGYGKGMVEAIQERVGRLEAPEVPLEVDRSNRNEKGQFLAEYNDVRPRQDPNVGAVFESVESKRTQKDLTRLSILKTSSATLEKKVHALMALPAVSEKGHFDGVTEPRGEWLLSLGGPDYMPETLAKFGRELKYAGVSEALLECHAGLWHRELKQSLGDDAACAVLYIDATSKPLWTEQFHLSGKVATLGRVMPCVETVLIDTGAGVPLYMRSFSGHAPLVKHALPLVHELEAAIGEGMLGRLTVIDGEMDSVALFKEFDRDWNGEKRWFITPLRTQQVPEPEKIEGYHHLVPYRDGDWISAGIGWIELVDSKDRKAPPYRARAIVMERRTKRTQAVFASNAPAELFTNEQLLDAFFARWPAQESIFRQLNGGVAFKAAHGYGKRKIQNITVIDARTKLAAQIEAGTQRLEKARSAEVEVAQQIHVLEIEQRRHQRLEESAQHTQVLLRNEAKAHTAAYHDREADEQRAHEAAEKSGLQLKIARAEHGSRHAKSQAIEQNIEDKRLEHVKLASRVEIYQTDVELDQILSIFKLGFALLVQVLLHRFFGGMAIELNTFVRQILALSGTRTRTKTTEVISFRATRRNPQMMQRLEDACAKINAIGHVNSDGRKVRFELSWPPGTRNHAA